MHVEIHRPTIKDIEEVKQLFSKTISNNFKQEGIIDTHQKELTSEIMHQVETLQQDIDTQGQKEYFLLAKAKQKIVGTIAYGTPSEIITKNLKVNSSDIPEIKSVYVLPEFQNKGIGSLLLSNVYDRLLENDIHEFFLDSGYKMAQSFWAKKLGLPICVLENYWGKNANHMIWHKRINKNKGILSP